MPRRPREGRSRIAIDRRGSRIAINPSAFENRNQPPRSRIATATASVLRVARRESRGARAQYGVGARVALDSGFRIASGRCCVLRVPFIRVDRSRLPAHVTVAKRSTEPRTPFADENLHWAATRMRGRLGERGGTTGGARRSGGRSTAIFGN